MIEADLGRGGHMSKGTSGTNWWVPIIAALIGAAATVIATLLANQAGAIHISISGASTPATAATLHPSATATAFHGGGPSGYPGAGQGGRTWTMAVPFSNYTSLYFDTGNIQQSVGASDAYYQPDATGVPELKINLPYSLDVTAANASKQQCLNVTSRDPNVGPITDFRRGLLFCVQTGSGVALLDETQALDGSKTLHLREVYWPSPGT
jgi:hypothetical protein